MNVNVEEQFEAANTCLKCNKCGSVKWHVRADNMLECYHCGVTNKKLKGE